MSSFRVSKEPSRPDDESFSRNRPLSKAGIALLFLIINGIVGYSCNELITAVETLPRRSFSAR